MSDFRYGNDARRLEEGLVEDLSEIARENAVKEAEAKGVRRAKLDGGLERIVTGKTPLDEVRQIIELKKKKMKTSSDVLREHRVRTMLRKVAGRRQRLVEEFLTATKS